MESPDLQQRFTGSAIRPLAKDAEVEMAAREFVTRISRQDDAAALTTAIDRWEKADRKKRAPRWQHLLWALVIVISLTVGIRDIPGMTGYAKWIAWGMAPFATPIPEARMDHFLERLPPEQRLLFQDPSDPGHLPRAEKLWRKEPENPAYFAEYAAAWIAEHDSLPPGYAETAARLDPGNAWFTYLAASITGKDAVKGNTRKSRKVGNTRIYDGPRTWTVIDATKLDASLALIRQARLQGKYDNYAAEMIAKRLTLLNPDNLIGRLDLIGRFASVSPPSASLPIRFLADNFSARAWKLAEDGNAAEFLELTKDADHFLATALASPPCTLVDELIHQVCLSGISESFTFAAEKLALPEQAAKWRPVWQQMDDRFQTKGERGFIVDGEPVPPKTITSGMFGSTTELVAKQAQHQPALTDADLEPGRMLDHEVLSRFSSYILWLILAVACGSTALYRFRIARMPRGLAERMQLLLTGRDWAWIMGAGVILPFLYVMVINRHTPLGGRAFGMTGTAMLMPLGHFIALGILWFILPVVLIRWRLAKSARAFAFPAPSLPAWLALACAVAFVPAIGWVATTRSFGPARTKLMNLFEMEFGNPPGDMVVFGVTAGLLAIALGWILTSIGIALFISSFRQVYRAALSMALVNTFAVAMIVTALSTLVFKSSERAWFAREKLGSLDPAYPGWSLWEYKVVVQIRKELREALGYKN